MTAAPQPPSKAELKASEEEAYITVQRVIAGSLLLYLCMPVRDDQSNDRGSLASSDVDGTAPFAIDYIKKLV